MNHHSLLVALLSLLLSSFLCFDHVSHRCSSSSLYSPFISALGDDDVSLYIDASNDDAPPIGSMLVETDNDDDDGVALAGEVDSRDEYIFDEAHQRGIIDMYGRDHHSPPTQPRETAGEEKSEDDAAERVGEDATATSSSISPSPHQSSPSPSPSSPSSMTPHVDPWDYAITIDCGSSGSRAHIYKWTHRHAPGSIAPFTPVYTKVAWSASVSPGISAFTLKPTMVRGQLSKLISFAKNSLSAFRAQWSRTPIYVKATAGMRLVRDLPSRDGIMYAVRSYLSDGRFNPFYFEPEMARVISGEEEGVYGWMSANYLLGTLMRSSSARSFGVLDMGGASVQITFRPPYDVLSNYFPLRIQQERIRLYSHSFLNFGMKRGLARVHDRIIQLANRSSSIEQSNGDELEIATFYGGMRDGVRVFRHPCYPLGYSSTYQYVSNLDLGASYSGRSKPTAQSASYDHAKDGKHGSAASASAAEASKPESHEYSSSDDAAGADMSPVTTFRPEQESHEMVTFDGGQDFASCSSLTWQLLHKKTACFDNTCSFDGVYQPRFGNVSFVAFSQFSNVVVGYLKLPHDATLKDIDLRSRAVCGLTWLELQSLEDNRYVSPSVLSTLCFNSRYVFTVLYKGFGFPYEGRNIVYHKSVMDLDISWALGSTLYETNAMTWDIDTPIRDCNGNATTAIATNVAMERMGTTTNGEDMMQHSRAHEPSPSSSSHHVASSSKYTPFTPPSPSPPPPSSSPVASVNTTTTSHHHNKNEYSVVAITGVDHSLLIGFLAGGWVVTIIAFVFYIRYAINRLEERSYEPIA